MIIISSPFPGTFLLKPRVFTDVRGDFVKTFHSGDFRALGIAFEPVEEFFSTSHKGVLRGMHFQLPPHDHDKLVYCVRGRVLDVLLDLRRNSPTYGKTTSAEISQENHLQFFIPRGVAHGFMSLEDNSVMIYQTSTVHAPSHDAGIRWDSIGFDWPVFIDPGLISTRDQVLPALVAFNSPF
jgi:dTDP-4-dehydrorhamnose 3,5-epimerase